jgi:hypothetical protein
MDAVILGVVGLLVGAVVALYGTRVFYVLLPLFGFVAGFVLGAQGVAALLDEGFLATVIGWGAGLILGVVFAVTALLWVWAAVLVLAFAVGTSLGSSVLLAIGFSPGVLPFAAAVVTGAVLVVAAVVLDAPTLLVALLTSLGGAAYLVAGALLFLGRIPLGDLSGGAIGALRDQPLALVGWLLVAAAAFVYQLQESGGGMAGLRTRLGQPVG